MMDEINTVGEELTQPVDITSDNFIVGLQEEMSQLLNKYPTPDDYLKEKYGYKAMDKDFSSLDDLDAENFIVDKLRGNVSLAKKSIMTNKMAEEIIEQAINAPL